MDEFLEKDGPIDDIVAEEFENHKIPLISRITNRMTDMYMFPGNYLESLKNLIMQAYENKKAKTWLADSIANVIAPLIGGGLVDHYFSNVDSWRDLIHVGLVRTAVNGASGGVYGVWREGVFSITETDNYDNRLRQSMADMIAYNSFQVPLYQAILVAGTYLSVGEVDLEKVAQGTLFLLKGSIILGPGLGYVMDMFRGVFNIKSASEESNV